MQEYRKCDMETKRYSLRNQGESRESRESSIRNSITSAPFGQSTPRSRVPPPCGPDLLKAYVVWIIALPRSRGSQSHPSDFQTCFKHNPYDVDP